MPEISVRGGLKKPAAPLGQPGPPPAPLRPAALSSMPSPARRRRRRINGRKLAGAMLLAGGILLAGAGWGGLAPAESERGWMLRLADDATVLKPVCACAGHLPQLGDCLRTGYLGAECSEWGREVTLPLAIPLAAALALAGAGASLLRRKPTTDAVV